MKRILFVLLTVFHSVNLFPAQTAKTNLKEVKVYINGAELKHTAAVKLNKGENEIFLEGLAGNFDPASVNIKIDGDVSILSITKEINFLKKNVNGERIKSLEDSLKILEEKLKDNNDGIDILKAEWELIVANKELKESDASRLIDNIKKLGRYYGERLTEIKAAIRKLDAANETIKNNIEKLKKQIEHLKDSRPQHDLKIALLSPSDQSVSIDVSYMTDDAGWRPNYDIRINNLREPPVISYKADIRQRSGIDWRNVKVILSTRNPQRSNIKPELNTWMIDFYDQPVYYGAAPKLKRETAAIASEDVLNNAVLTQSFRQEQNILTTDFVPALSYTIPSDGIPHSVLINDFEAEAYYKYYAVPKHDENAFLVIDLVNWKQFDLLEGEVNIYLENTYAGKSYIETNTASDTLRISAGRDQSVIAKRKLIRDYKEGKFLSKNVVRSFTYELSLNNKKRIPVEITLQDNIPVSKNEDIKVELIESGGASFNPSTGIIEWKVKLEPEETKTARYTFSVQYPGDKIIPGL
ncbi:mucoidy inhibitor-like protein [Melioribacter roseus P3M-2]|uniref:Mucoidy inhibitor-like protein n=1 Tax=Melioribacter roseus (strain DSM 23840 / JCM 17771 / VKM B-2668 / P3M-2) TaxID=1191523 RepID=I6ZRN5_MELRP|nr:DUF4139 domain-containing protein [Melioribacter roseus]AFN74729.1 mucoidy inhibitor-like protein [Melioribacter roseus P3M-2]